MGGSESVGEEGVLGREGSVVAELAEAGGDADKEGEDVAAGRI